MIDFCDKYYASAQGRGLSHTTPTRGGSSCSVDPEVGLLPPTLPLTEGHTNPGTRCRPLATINTRWHQPPRTAVSQPRAWFNQ